MQGAITTRNHDAPDGSKEDPEDPSDLKYDVEQEVQGLIDTMEETSSDRRSRVSNSMRVEEVEDQDLRMTSRLVDNEEQLLAEANFRAAAERKSYCFSRTCIWHLALTLVIATLIVVGALLIAGSNSSNTSTISSQKSAPDITSNNTSSTISLPPDNLGELCSLSNIVTTPSDFEIDIPTVLPDSRTDCEKACEPALCCYLEGTTSCFNDHPEACAAYMVCFNVFAPLRPSTVNITEPLTVPTPSPVLATASPVSTITSISPPPDELNSLCDKDAIEQGVSTRAACRDACAPSNCCFDVDRTTNCFNFKNNKNLCARYHKYCAILHPTSAPSAIPTMTKRPSAKPSAKPTTLAPITLPPTTLAPVTGSPTTQKPTTLAPVTGLPITLSPTTLAPVTGLPITLPPTTLTPVTVLPIADQSITAAPIG